MVGGDCVTVFSPSGERLRSFGTCMVLVRDSLIILMEWQWMVRRIFSWLIVNNHRIQKFTAQGEFLTAVGYSR